MNLAGIPKDEQIPLWMLYKPQGSQVIQIDNGSSNDDTK